MSSRAGLFPNLWMTCIKVPVKLGIPVAFGPVDKFTNQRITEFEQSDQIEKSKDDIDQQSMFSQGSQRTTQTRIAFLEARFMSLALRTWLLAVTRPVPGLLPYYSISQCTPRH